MVSANASWALSLDNLSRVEPWLSDALCRIATGGGFATRELYSDDDEVIFDAQRPVIINGIEEVATRSDLLDRALLLHLPPIPADKRRNEKELWAAVNQAQPALLGALLDGLVCALANIDTVKVERLPRMADFALWVAAAEPGLGWEPGSFLATYEQNRGQMHELAVEATPAGQALVELARQGFHGTAAELLQALNQRVEETTDPSTRMAPRRTRDVRARPTDRTQPPRARLHGRLQPRSRHSTPTDHRNPSTHRRDRPNGPNRPERLRWARSPGRSGRSGGRKQHRQSQHGHRGRAVRTIGTIRTIPTTSDPTTTRRPADATPAV